MPTAKNKKFTVSEFQTWLDGIMEFQESGWSPSAEQWKAIYQKIQNLKEPPQSPRKVAIEEGSIEEIVEEVVRYIPDFSSVDFELMQNMVQTIVNSLRQGRPVAVAPSNTETDPNSTNHNPTPPQVSTNLEPAPPVQGADLANLSLSQIKEQQGHATPANQKPASKILEPGEGTDDFV